MSQPIAKPSNISNSRCQHRYAHGKRCRLSISNLDSAFCPIHSPLPGYETDSSEVAAALTANLSEFRSAIAVNDFLARLLLLLAQNRISPRKAAVLAYITNQLLRTLPAIDRELNPPEDDRPPQIVFDPPRPRRSADPAEPPKREPTERIDRQATPASVAQPANPQPASSATVPPPSQAVPSPPQPRSQAPVSSHAGSPATPATMAQPVLPGSFGLPQADPLGSSRGSTRPSVRQPTWADVRT